MNMKAHWLQYFHIDVGDSTSFLFHEWEILFKVDVRTCCGSCFIAHVFEKLAPNIVSEGQSTNLNTIQDVTWLKSNCVYNLKFQNVPYLSFCSFQLRFRTGLRCYTERKKKGYLCDSKSEISNVCNAVEGHCLQAMKIVHHHTNDCFDW